MLYSPTLVKKFFEMLEKNSRMKFDIQSQVQDQVRVQLEALETRIAELEKAAGRSQPSKSNQKREL